MTLEEIFVCQKVSKYRKLFKTCFPTNPSFQMMRYLYVVVFPFLVNTAMLGFAPLVASAHGVLQKLNVKVSKFSKVLGIFSPINTFSKIQTGRRQMNQFVVVFRFHVNIATNAFAPWVESANGAAQQLRVCQKVSKYSKVL